MTTAEMNLMFDPNHPHNNEFYGLFCEGINVNETPIIDDVTKLVTTALRIAKPGEKYRGFHTTPHGKRSSNCNYFINVKMNQFGDSITKLGMNSLAVYYAAYCRDEFDKNDWAFIEQLQKLGLSLSEPTKDELEGEYNPEDYVNITFDIWNRDELEIV